MLRMAVKAHFPLIRVESDDPVNIGAVLSEIAGTDVDCILDGTLAKKLTSLKVGSVTYVMGSDKLDPTKLYSVYAQKHATLIVVNGPPHKAYFEAGFVTAPKKMIQKFVMKHAIENVLEITDALSGLSFKQAVEISKLAMTEHNSYTPRGVQKIRRKFFGTLQGLEQVGDCSPLYQPNAELTDWLTKNSMFVFGWVHELFRPRGLLFGGPPGTGKTEGAKLVAMMLKQPLYRMNIGALMSKWSGESEHNLEAALRQAENCAPCVLLFDEVEKLFAVDDAGVSTRLLATLLWWLSEHKERVFTIMTTNKQASVPPELVRPGRIDKWMLFPPLKGILAIEKFTEAMLKELIPFGKLTHGERLKLKNELYEHNELSHADLTGRIISALKQAIVTKANVGA